MKFPLVSRKAYDLLKKERKEIDWLMWFSGIVGPLSTIPQIWTVFVDKNVAGLSLLTGGLYTVSSMIGLLYAMLHRLGALVVSNTLWLIVNGLVAAGVVLYR
jgi:uncharacterized protein with PQ loop repeat